MTENHNVNYFKSKGTFQIAIGAETFRMFSAGLYSNQVLAIIRELSTNAKDAQAEAGTKDKAFDIHLPRTDTPIFYIRDYGTGMSTETIETVYQTYGASTKRETNQCTGKFGLGSKSPLSYVNSFGVTSFYNGMRSQYIVALNDEEIPELLFDGNPVKTDEPNGLKVQFAIDPKDVSKFMEAAKEAYPYFDVPINFVGTTVPEIEKPEYVMEGDEKIFKWKARRAKNFSSYYGSQDRKSYIIMGCNRYPLLNSLAHDFDSAIDFFVEIDTFEPTPSRESLTWSDDDIKKFKGMHALAKKRIAERFNAEIKGLGQWEVYAAYNKYDDSYVAKVANDIHNFHTTHHILDDALSYRISFSQQSLWIQSSAIEVQACYTSSIGTGNAIIGKNTGQRGMGKFGGAIIAAKNVTPTTPVNLVSYDAKGVKTAAEHFPANTVIIGRYDSKTNAADIKLLEDELIKQKVPVKTDTLSNFLKTVPKKARSTSAAPVSSLPAAPRVTGIFEFKHNFIRIEDISPFEYYIPFEEENTFNITEFFNGSCKVRKWSDSIREIDNKLTDTSFEKIASALGLKNHKDIAQRICFIRPRFVKNYDKQLTELLPAWTKALEKKFVDNWMGFMAYMMTDYRFYEDSGNHRYNDCRANSYARHRISDPFTREAALMFSWMRQQRQIWLGDYVTYPFISRIMDTMVTHRWNKVDTFYDSPINSCHTKYYSGKRSDEATLIVDQYNVLTRWMFPVSKFVEIYRPWIDRFNEEVRSLLRTHPYLFKSQDQLIFNATILQGRHNLACAKTLVNIPTEEEREDYDED